MFCLIVLQLHFRLDHEGINAPSSHSSPPRSVPGYPLQPLSIHVTHTQNVDSDELEDFGGSKPSQASLGPFSVQ